MKKTICALLAIILIFSTSVAVYASDTENLNTRTKCFTYNGHGEFTAVKLNVLASIFANDSLNNLDVGKKIIALSTQDNEFYQISNSEKYLAVCTDDKYVLTDKITVDIENDNEELFDLYNISKYLRNDIQKVIQEQKALNNTNLKIELFIPSESVPQTGVSVYTIEPTGTNYYTYTLNGKSYKLKDVSVKYDNLSVRADHLGSSTINVAKNFVSLVFSSIDGVSKTLAVFGKYAGIAMSAYELYKSIYGEVIRSSSDDYILTNIIFKKIIKETYAEDTVKHDYPNAGCVSQKIWLDRNDTYHFYPSKGGDSGLTTTNLKVEIFTPNFKNPAPVAISNGISSMHYDMPLRTTIYGHLAVL